MNGLTLPLILQAIALLVVIAEVILPSGGLLSLLAAGLFGYSLYLVSTNAGEAALLAFVVADLVLIPLLVVLAFRLLARSPVTLRNALRREEGASGQQPGLNSFLGQEGITHSPLRPSGIAEFDGRRLDVLSRGEFIEPGTPVVVVAVQANQLIVARKEAPTAHA